MLTWANRDDALFHSVVKDKWEIQEEEFGAGD